MIIDARDARLGSALDAPVCVVGAGIAGLSIAMALADAGVASCVLEAGGAGYSRASQALYHGHAERYDLAGTRARCLGGSSHCWGGWTRPLSELDFASRGWVPDISWPIGEPALLPFYGRASDLLEVPAPVPDEAVAAQARADGLSVLATGEQPLRTAFFSMSPPTRFATAYRERIAASSAIRVLLHAPAVEIVASEDGRSVVGVVARTEHGDLRVAARYVVLAAGGVENPRLLLASNAVHRAGLGNAGDLVGRYFMDHPRIMVGRVRFRGDDAAARLYDARHYGDGSLLVRRGRVGAALVPTAAAQSRAAVLQSYTGLLACYAGQDHAATFDAIQLCKALSGQVHRRIDRSTLWRAVRSLPTAGASLAARRIGLRTAIRGYELATILEPWPDPDNRVTLAPERDAVGLPRVRLRWRVGELERRTHRHAVELVAKAVSETGLATVDLAPDLWDDGWHERVISTWHHMGTTRMAATPGRGVVDPDCKVFGLENLSVAGSSVFPSGGGGPPTFTIVSLALRLADRIRSVLARPQAEITLRAADVA